MSLFDTIHRVSLRPGTVVSLGAMEPSTADFIEWRENSRHLAANFAVLPRVGSVLGNQHLSIYAEIKLFPNHIAGFLNSRFGFRLRPRFCRKPLLFFALVFLIPLFTAVAQIVDTATGDSPKNESGTEYQEQALPRQGTAPDRAEGIKEVGHHTINPFMVLITLVGAFGMGYSVGSNGWGTRTLATMKNSIEWQDREIKRLDERIKELHNRR